MTDAVSPQLDGLFKFFSRIPVPVPDRPTDMANPDKAIVREVYLKKSGKSLELKFSKRPAIVNLPNNGNGAQFAKLLADVAAGHFPYPPNQPGIKPDMALNNQQLSYIVFLLSDDTDWQFAHDYPPISLSPLAHDSGCYFEANRVDANGDIVPMLDGSGNVVLRDGCRVAYFIADGAAAVATNPAGYIHPYNLNVDFLELDHGQIAHRLAVTIDPDVRNPGGN